MWLGSGIGGFARSVRIHLRVKVAEMFANFGGFCDVTDRVKWWFALSSVSC